MHSKRKRLYFRIKKQARKAFYWTDLGVKLRGKRPRHKSNGTPLYPMNFRKRLFSGMGFVCSFLVFETLSLAYHNSSRRHKHRRWWKQSVSRCLPGCARSCGSRSAPFMQTVLHCPSKIRWYVLHCDDSKNRGETFCYDLQKAIRSAV